MVDKYRRKDPIIDDVVAFENSDLPQVIIRYIWDGREIKVDECFTFPEEGDIIVYENLLPYAYDTRSFEETFELIRES